MKVIIGIDDTDNKETKGTGHLAKEMCMEIERSGWGSCTAISRHQLYVHEDIPYTSHNSGMCFEAVLEHGCYNTVVDFSRQFLKTRSAEGSDPGLCVAILETLADREALETFGRDAKQQVLTKEDAYRLARHLGIHLSEHGGTGQGVIGAVAGIGLRLSGNDGRFRGWYHLGLPGEEIPVSALCSHAFIDGVKSRNGGRLEACDTVILGDDKVKTVLLEGQQVVLVTRVGAPSGIPRWRTLTKQEVKAYDNAR